MYETDDDLMWLQDVLDRSAASGGRHLKDVITQERRLSAEGLSHHLQGMCLLVLATVSSDGRPINGAVDGIFHRGRFYFGSAPDSIRFRHIRRNPAVSATHLPGEHLQVTVHGRAEVIDPLAPEHELFARQVSDYYDARYGEGWLQSMASTGAQFARIEPERMFTFFMPEA